MYTDLRRDLPVSRLCARRRLPRRVRWCALQRGRRVVVQELQAGTGITRLARPVRRQARGAHQVRWTDATQVPFYGVGNDIREGRPRQLRAARRSTRAVRHAEAGAVVPARRRRRVSSDRGSRGRRLAIRRSRRSPVRPCPASSRKRRYTQTTAFTAIDWRESPGYTRRGGLYSVTFNDFKDADDRLELPPRRCRDAAVPPAPEGALGARLPRPRRRRPTSTTTRWCRITCCRRSAARGGTAATRTSASRTGTCCCSAASTAGCPRGSSTWRCSSTPARSRAERRDLDFDDLKTAYGIGFRIHGPTFTPLRLDVAHGDEGFRVHITGGVRVLRTYQIFNGIRP